MKCFTTESVTAVVEAYIHVHSTLRLKVHAHWTDDKNRTKNMFHTEQSGLTSDPLACKFVPFSFFHMRSLFLTFFPPVFILYCVN